MHGIIVTQFKEYLRLTALPVTWLEVVHDLGLDKPLKPSPLQTYEDDLFAGLVNSASRVLQREPFRLLEGFGHHLAHFFYNTYRHMISEEWTFVDMLLKTEDIMHRQVRFVAEGADPPRLQISSDQHQWIEMIYDSERRLCWLAKGIIQGFAEIYEVSVDWAEDLCMLRGDHHCRIVIRILPV